MCHQTINSAVILLFCFLASFAEATTISASANFQENGGPKDADQGNPVGDLFTITNDSDIGEISQIMIQLASGLLFDTDILANTAGTAPAFPFTGSTSGPTLVSGSSVADGATQLSLTFANFGPGKSYSFSIDVDRTGQHNDNQNRHVIGNDMNAVFSVTIVGATPNPITLTQEFTGHGQDASAAVLLVPEPTAFSLAVAALGVLLTLAACRHNALGVACPLSETAGK